MDHREIEEKHLLERYVQGRLNDEEAGPFEAHLLECGECFDQVRWSEDLGHALRVAAAEDVARAAVGTGIMTWLAGVGRRRATAWLLGLALLAAPSVLYLRERARLQTLIEPQINTPVFSLGATRDGAPNRVSLGATPEWIVLALAPSFVGPASYRAILLNATGDVVWRGDGLVPDAGDRLVISLYSTLLRPGAYELRISGSQQSPSIVDESFSFEVVR